LNISIIADKSKITISFLILFFIGLGIRFYYFPYDLPLTFDGLDNFTYATAINYYGYLPLEWTSPNIGWPLFLSFWFSLINLENTLDYMQLQRIISIILSSMITIPVYFLCRKFFDQKIALVGAALFVFDPRIILNSLLGITEPLFILLGISSLVIFLKYDRKWIIVSFILVSFTSIVRAEGIFLFATFTILFFIKFIISKEILKTYLPCVIIFLLILAPSMYYKIEVTGNDAMFQRVASGTGQILANTSQDGTNEIISGLELFITYLGWIMIPIFIVFLPFGIIQFLNQRTKETNFIIVYFIVVSLPILYGYIMQAQDTRYLYILFPIFSLISLFAVKKYISKFPRKNIILLIIVVGILISSIGFYEYKKINHEKEKELNEIALIVSNIVSGINFHPSETAYVRSAQLPDKWPFVFPDEKYQIKIVSTSNHKNLESFILDSRNELSHLIIDDNVNLPEFLQEVYHNEEKYLYLNKVFDSKSLEFKYNLKLFEINFERFDSMILEKKLNE
jgi:hypothetical protein